LRFSPIAVLFTPYVVDTLHISTGWIGPTQAGDTAGNILGALAATRVTPRALTTTGMLMLAVLIAALA
jgi:hypothetical protein